MWTSVDQSLHKYSSLVCAAAEDPISGKAAFRTASVTEQKQLCKERGVTGGRVYRLNDLCGFVPIQDLTIDAMHVITLNLVRTELAHSGLLRKPKPGLQVSNSYMPTQEQI